MRSAFRFLRHISKGFRTRIGMIVLIGLAEVIFSLAFVWFSKRIIDIATGERQGIMLQSAIILVVLVILQNLFRLWDIRLRRMTEVRLGNNIRYKIFSHLLYTRWQEISSMHSGDMLTRIIKDSDDIVGMMVTALPLTVVAATQFAGALVILYLLDPTLALILGIGLPLLIFLSKLYYTHMRKYTLEVKEGESMITSMIEESLLNQIVIRTFERQESELKRLGELQSKLRRNVHKRTNVSVFANLMMGIAFNGGYITAFLWSAYGLAKREVTFGTVTAYLQLVSRIQQPLFDLIRSLPTIVAARTAVERLIFLTSFTREDTKEKILLTGNVTLTIHHLSFAYSPEANPVFSDFSIVLKPGTMVAITGETGVGKTTLLRLLLSLVKPDTGIITLQDEAHSATVSERTRCNFVYVPQGNSLFSGTIRENLLLGNPGANDNELARVLHIASADFVFDLPDGLKTLLGENGAGLSEGQAQRIAIARAFLRPGKILLMDEATSALDPETEHVFLQNLKKEMGNRIILFITHHTKVASFCDYQYNLTS